MTLLLCSDKFFTRTPSVTATKKRFVLCGFSRRKRKITTTENIALTVLHSQFIMYLCEQEIY
ncbi:hypothetical protein TF3313_1145 [Tannerella forsythia 3313]|nr:hypothetical protein TF3313_1145 [Tannerella forsythia 3313]